jgi:hypothetical protein
MTMAAVPFGPEKRFAIGSISWNYRCLRAAEAAHVGDKLSVFSSGHASGRHLRTGDAGRDNGRKGSVIRSPRQAAHSKIWTAPAFTLRPVARGTVRLEQGFARTRRPCGALCHEEPYGELPHCRSDI